MRLREFRIDILKKDMDFCAAKVNHFDLLRMRTRQTALALWTAALGFGFKEGITGLFILAAVLPIPFWIIEARYRRYERGWNLRLRAIRDFIRDGEYLVRGETLAHLSEFLESDEPAAFPTIDFWARRTVPETEHQKETSLLRNFFNRVHLLLYLPPCVVATVAAIWWIAFRPASNH